MSQLSPSDGRKRTGSTTISPGSVPAGSVSAGSVSMTPPPPEPPQLSALERQSQAFGRSTASPLGDDDELGPSLTSAQLMRSAVTERYLPDLSVSNEALLASLRPAAENTLSLRTSRMARAQGQRALYWFGTRPSWLQATLSVVGGSIVGLSLVVAYARTFHAPPKPEVAAEPGVAGHSVALAVAAAPAAMIAQRVIQPLAAAPARAATPVPAAKESAVPAASDSAAEGAADDEAAAEESDESDARKPGRRQRASKAAASSKLPAWVQQQIKPQVQRSEAREKRAAAREKRAAALREKKARRSRAKAREE